MIDRRKFFFYAAAALSSASIASSIVVAQWWDTAPQTPYTNLSTEEANTVLLISKSAFPAGEHHHMDGAQAQLDRFLDQFLSQINDQNRKLLKLLLQATERISIPTHGSYFSNLAENQQQRCIEDLVRHPQHLIRSAYQSLIAILGMGYSTHPDMAEKIATLHRCGYG